jgi:hypothetical protein
MGVHDGPEYAARSQETTNFFQKRTLFFADNLAILNVLFPAFSPNNQQVGRFSGATIYWQVYVHR